MQKMYAKTAEPNPKLLRQLDDLLADPSAKEPAFQALLEEHPELICTPLLQNHMLHDAAVISQFAVNPALTTDFAYLTKSSNVWWLVLVEIEPPSVPLFTSAVTLQPTAEFSRRIAQVESWERAYRSHPQEILRRLQPLLRPLSSNAVELRTVLICGRDESRLFDPAARDWLAQQETKGRKILTWDSVRRFYENGRNVTKNILSIHKDRFHFKRLLVEPPNMFTYMEPHELALSASDKAQLEAWDYQIGDWGKGLPLKYNDKYATLGQRRARMPL